MTKLNKAGSINTMVKLLKRLVRRIEQEVKVIVSYMDFRSFY